jgi:hypothetical protein
MALSFEAATRHFTDLQHFSVRFLPIHDAEIGERRARRRKIWDIWVFFAHSTAVSAFTGCRDQRRILPYFASVAGQGGWRRAQTDEQAVNRSQGSRVFPSGGGQSGVPPQIDIEGPFPTGNGPSAFAGTGDLQVTGRAAGESACRPGSVHPLARAGGHPSRAAVAGSLERSTREHRAGHPQSLAQDPRQLARIPLDLAPGGVYRAARVAPGAGGLLHHRFTLTA